MSLMAVILTIISNTVVSAQFYLCKYLYYNVLALCNLSFGKSESLYSTS